MSSSARRCPEENSPQAAVACPVMFSHEFSDGVSDSLDIAFSPPRQNEGLAPPLFRFAIDPRPEGNKILAGGKQREQNHEPNRQPRKPVDGENIKAADRPFVPAASKNRRHHG